MVESPIKLSATVTRKLLKVYSDEGPERCGLILKTGKVVEVVNTSPTPEDSFTIPVDDMFKYEDKAAATFHTHPGTGNNLSADDYVGFRGWPDLCHIIVGNDGLSIFTVNGKGAVIRHEA